MRAHHLLCAHRTIVGVLVCWCVYRLARLLVLAQRQLVELVAQPRHSRRLLFDLRVHLPAQLGEPTLWNHMVTGLGYRLRVQA